MASPPRPGPMPDPAEGALDTPRDAALSATRDASQGAVQDASLVLPLAEEALVVRKQMTTTGRVRVRTVVDTIEKVVGADLASDTAEVTRVPIDREVDAVPFVRTEGDVTILPVVEEVIVVEKRLVLKEEIHIRRVRSSEHVELPVSLRRERAVVEREGSDTPE